MVQHFFQNNDTRLRSVIRSSSLFQQCNNQSFTNTEYIPPANLSLLNNRYEKKEQPANLQTAPFFELPVPLN